MKSIIEQLLLAYIRCSPIRWGKYRLVEKFGRGALGQENCVRQARLKYGGYQMECDLRKMLQRQFYFFGTYYLEMQILAEWSRQAKIAQVVFDIGANAGIFSLAAAASNPLAKIYAFEPTPEIATHFRKTIEQNCLNSRIFLHQAAVTRETGTAHLNFFTGEHNDNEGMNFVTVEGRSESSAAVNAISIDDFCSQQGLTEIGLVKIDVQGNEPDVLAGSERLLRGKAIKTIFVELNWHQTDPANCPASKVVSMLEQAGYKFADPKLPLKFHPAGPWLHALSDVIAT